MTPSPLDDVHDLDRLGQLDALLTRFRPSECHFSLNIRKVRRAHAVLNKCYVLFRWERRANSKSLEPYPLGVLMACQIFVSNIGELSCV